MRNRVLLAVLCLVAVCAAAQDAPQTDDFDATFAKVRAFMATERETMIEEELGLTSAERDAFWPVYEAYRAEIETYQDQYAELIEFFTENYAALTDEAALKMIEDYYRIETGTLDARRRWVERFIEIIPARKLARFYQLENKIDAIAELPMVMDVPLMGEPSE
jgi:hypothetical protein